MSDLQTPIRIEEPQAGVLLEQLTSAGLLQQGKAHLVSVEGVRVAFGPRWDDRKALVWDMAETQLRRRIADHDFCVRISDVDFLLVTPNLEAAPAQVMAASALRAILNHFLGEARPADIAIHRIAAFGPAGIECRTVEPQELAAAEAAHGSGATESIAPASNANADTGEASYSDGLKWEPLTTFDGRQLKVSFAVDPIIDLQRWAIAGHRVEARMLYAETGLPLPAKDRAALLPTDMERVDLATLERGLSRLTLNSADKPPSLILTVSFLTASNMRARSKLIMRANRGREAMRRSVIWEMTDFGDGLPSGRLTEIASLMRPFCRSVFAQTSPVGAVLQSARSAGLAGLVLQPDQVYADETDASIWLLQAGKLAAKGAPSLIAANVPSSELLPIAAAAGFTHATVRVPNNAQATQSAAA